MSQSFLENASSASKMIKIYTEKKYGKKYSIFHACLSVIVDDCVGVQRTIFFQL